MEVGDFVWVTEKYNPETMELEKIKKTIKKIVRFQELPTFGRIYLLAGQEGTIMKIWYYESQLSPVASFEDEEKMWEIWGSI